MEPLQLLVLKDNEKNSTPLTLLPEQISSVIFTGEYFHFAMKGSNAINIYMASDYRNPRQLRGINYSLITIDRKKEIEDYLTRIFPHCYLQFGSIGWCWDKQQIPENSYLVQNKQKNNYLDVDTEHLLLSEKADTYINVLSGSTFYLIQPYLKNQAIICSVSYNNIGEFTKTLRTVQHFYCTTDSGAKKEADNTKSGSKNEYLLVGPLNDKAYAAYWEQRIFDRSNTEKNIQTIRKNVFVLPIKQGLLNIY
ncbi:hypothetical protein GPZ88_10250 (plasmid) [Streptococcus ruminicola]|uniref:Uncharacterized protein n=1 Tax=Streptococcus ruminicola TaxID=2686210 RepID=A0A6G8I2T3_9STRE|nr:MULTISPECIES: hypothetical protein [Streptococcus]QGX47399.1 hypothetical protein GPA00_09705 [Streptococcus equinus]QIM47447.1 hypothetical protein GPZ88_10250 [Streptococcus ruminicola]